MEHNSAFLVVGRDNIILYWRDEMAALTGHISEEIVGGNMDALIHPDLREMHYTGFERAWADGFVAALEKNPEAVLDVPVRCKDEEYRGMRISINTTLSSAGSLMVLVASFALID
ncbi:MAG: PAS domain-containing protein [Actinobacteria bacterium]|nr:PAS domain-containing protein [Actinomycetota bacterium]